MVALLSNKLPFVLGLCVSSVHGELCGFSIIRRLEWIVFLLGLLVGCRYRGLRSHKSLKLGFRVVVCVCLDFLCV